MGSRVTRLTSPVPVVSYMMLGNIAVLFQNRSQVSCRAYRVFLRRKCAGGASRRLLVKRTTKRRNTRRLRISRASRLRGELLERRIVLSVESLVDPAALEFHDDHDLSHHDDDPAIRVSVSGHRYYFDPPIPPRLDGSVATAAPETLRDASEVDFGTTHPLDALPILHSNPAASIKFYLDFDGHLVEGTRWNDENGGRTIHAPAYDVDGDPTTFSDEELRRIDLIWQRVSEDFLPFDVDITTEFPGQAALEGDRQAIRALISTNIDDESLGGSGDAWFSKAGGVAFISSWLWKSDTPVWAFYNELDDTTEKPVAEALSHELGHAVGLGHDGQSGGTPYYRGHGDGEVGWAPIMGAGYDRELTQWDKGDYLGASNLERDIRTITARVNRIVYREDDHGNWEGDATPLDRDHANVSGAGIISRRNDADAFSFVHDGGEIAIDVTPAEVGANLDVVVELYDEDGELIELYEPPDTISVSLRKELPAGTYYLVVDGGGRDVSGEQGYTDYGSLGRFTIRGQVNIVPSLAAVAGGPYEIGEGESLALAANASHGTSLTFAWDLNGDGQFDDASGEAPVVSWQQLGELDPPIDDDGDYVVILRVTDSDGTHADSVARLTVRNQNPEIASIPPSSITAGEQVAFKIEASDIPGDPLQYQWDFGDGSPVVTGHTTTQTHVFEKSGDFTVELTARDDDGGVTTHTFQVQVMANLPRTISASLQQDDIVTRLDELRVQFSHDVSASLDATDLLIFNSTTNRVVETRNVPLVWFDEERVARWDFSAIDLRPGTYTAALIASRVTDQLGRVLDGDGDGLSGGDWIQDFTVTVAGDVNLDYRVDFSDFAIVAANFGLEGGWSSGDFDDDNKVGFTDFLLLAHNWNAE